MLVDEHAIADFYRRKLPEHVLSVHDLKRWLRSSEASNGSALEMDVADLLQQPDVAVADGAFPDRMQVNELQLGLTYEYSPGDRDDGVTVRVPKEGLKQLDPNRLGWLVPGLLEEKVMALIRSLPKSLRRNFVPAPDVAKKIVAQATFGQGEFNARIADLLTRYCGEKIRAEDFRDDALPQHLRMNIEVIDDRGKRLIGGRDLDQICKKMGVERHVGQVDVVDHSDAEWKQDGLKDWTWRELPERITIHRGGVDIPAFPAVLDQGEAVGLRLLDSAQAAELRTRHGLIRLFSLRERKELKRQAQWLPRLDQHLVHAANLADRSRWIDEISLLIAARSFAPRDPGTPPWRPPRNASAFQESCDQARRRIPAAADETARLIGPLFDARHKARLAIESLKGDRFSHAVSDARTQLKDLTSEGFLTTTPWSWLVHFARYMQAIAARLEKLQHGGLDRDRRGLMELQPHLQRLSQSKPEDAIRSNPEWIEYRWMIEEFRVSLFAQDLGTSIKISSQRLDKQWAKTG